MRTVSAPAVVATLAVVVTLLGTPAATAADTAPLSPQARTDQLLFHTPIDGFLAVRGAHPPGLDWSSDDCSVPVLTEPERSQPHGFDFRAACERHDFGYRNYRAQGRLTEDARRRIDDNFLADMNAVCDGVSGWFGLKQPYCRRTARDYHFWVRSCGANPAPFCPAVARDRFEALGVR